MHWESYFRYFGNFYTVHISIDLFFSIFRGWPWRRLVLKSYVWRRRTPERSQKFEKLLEKSAGIFNMYNTFGKESEIQEIFSKNVKKSIFHGDFKQNISKLFSWNFTNYSSFWSNRAKICMQVSCTQKLLKLSWSIEIIQQILMIFHFSTNFSRFSPKITRIFIAFPIVLLDLSHFCEISWRIS